MQAALDCIAEEGIAAASAARIAQRCNLSWGVIQYHFGDRSGLFLALFEWALDRLRRQMTRLEVASGDLGSRLEALVKGTWLLLKDPRYRALLEVQLQLSRDPGTARALRTRSAVMRREIRNGWRKALPDRDHKRVDQAQRLAITCLRGLALERATTGGSRRTPAGERQALVAVLVEMIE